MVEKKGKEKTEMKWVIGEIVIYVGEWECAHAYGILHDIFCWISRERVRDVKVIRNMALWG
jgi:hypothetical protein